MSTTNDYYNQVAGVVNARRAEIEADLVEAERLMAAATIDRDVAHEEFVKAARRVASFRNLLTIADGELPEPVQPSSSQWMKLHLAMEKVLKQATGHTLTAYEIAVQVEEQRLYRMRDGRSVEPQQIHARVGNYPRLFERAGDGAITLRAKARQTFKPLTRLSRFVPPRNGRVFRRVTSLCLFHAQWRILRVMGECCDPGGYDDTFGTRFARRTARRYRRRGLNRTQRSIVDFLAQDGGLDGASVLEVGGGIGDLHLELLRRGASRVTNLEISTGYEAEAEALFSASGMTDLVTRRRHDIATDPEAVEPADVVVLHRVVCCYPDYQRLLGAAASHALRRLVFSHPPSTPVVRSSFALDNQVRRLRRNDFRAFVHPPAAMYAWPRPKGSRSDCATGDGSGTSPDSSAELTRPRRRTPRQPRRPSDRGQVVVGAEDVLGVVPPLHGLESCEALPSPKAALMRSSPSSPVKFGHTPPVVNGRSFFL